MKKQLLVLVALLCAILPLYAQTTYYWVTDASGDQDWTVSSNWNTAMDGSGTGRTAPATNDMLIFDATSFTNKTISLINMPEQSIGSLHLKGGVTMIIKAVDAWPAASNGTLISTAYGGSTYQVVGSGADFTGLKAGDVLTTRGSWANEIPYGVVLAVKDATNMTISKELGATFENATAFYKVKTLYTDDLQIEAGSTLQLAYNSSAGGFISYVVSTKGGTVNGTVNFASRGGGCKLICTTRNDLNATAGLRFKNGSLCYINTSTSSKSNFNLGATLGTYSGTDFIIENGTGINNQTPGFQGAAGIVFEAGSTFKMGAGGNYTPFGSSIYATAPLVFTPAVSFLSGSNYIHGGGFSSTRPYMYVGDKAFYPNLEISAGTPDNMSLGRVENLLISGTTAEVTASTGTILVTGNISNTTANSINFGNIIMANQNSGQTIGGAGQGNIVFGDVIIADKAVVGLGSNISATNVHLVGKINFGANKLTGTGNFSTYGTYNTTSTSDLTKGGNNIGGGINSTSSLSLTPGVSTYNFPLGASLTNANLPANTLYSSYSGSGSGKMSNYAVADAAGETLTFSTAGSSFTVPTDLSTSAPGFANYYLDINGPSVLPLKLVRFDGAVATNGVALKWESLNEEAVRAFVVEKRMSSDSEFLPITTVPAQNKTINNYNYTDYSTFGDLAYYRLKMVDMDGTFSYSKIVVLKFLPGTAQLTVFPNPATAEISVQHSGISKGSIVISAMDGKVVMRQNANNSGRSSLNVNHLTPGVYTLTIFNTNQKETVRFIKQ
ncbi:T9SS type A sorting domain-containing protein [Pelobium manganitolerans]|uniref:T9SS type A sorting domain-containing protein n=1 Tax=Pelobium manganitolerans TaxID=1842495 RepID=UPI003FA35E56